MLIIECYVLFKFALDRPPPRTGWDITKNIAPTLGIITQYLLPDPGIAPLPGGVKNVSLLGRDHHYVSPPWDCTFIPRGGECITVGSEISLVLFTEKMMVLDCVKKIMLDYLNP